MRNTPRVKPCLCLPVIFSGCNPQLQGWPCFIVILEEGSIMSTVPCHPMRIVLVVLFCPTWEICFTFCKHIINNILLKTATKMFGQVFVFENVKHISHVVQIKTTKIIRMGWHYTIVCQVTSWRRNSPLKCLTIGLSNRDTHADGTNSIPSTHDHRVRAETVYRQGCLSCSRQHF